MPTNRRREEALSEAFAYLNEHPDASYRSVAHQFSLNKTTLINHYEKQTRASRDAHQNQQKFTPEEEERIVRWVIELDDMGMPPRGHLVRKLMLGILQGRGHDANNQSPQLGKRFLDRFRKRHAVLSSRFAQAVNRERALAGDPTVLNHFFNRLIEIRSLYHILPENIWNMDEKGFLLGVSSQEKVLCHSTRKNPRLVQEGGREWITLVEAIGAGGQTIAPHVIYKGEAQHMGWHDYEEREEATFALSPSGWSNNYTGFKWLSEHFHPRTQPIDQDAY